MKRNVFLSVSAALFAVAVCFSGCKIVSNDDKDTETYTVTFNANAGAAAVTSLSAPLSDIESGSKVTKPADPVRSGYIFGGWYREGSCTTKWNFESDTVTSSVTLYAQWLDEDTYCVITFDTGTSGWDCERLIVEKGSVVNVETYYMTRGVAYYSTDPDFGIDDVFTDSGYTNEADDTYTVNESMTFYIKMLQRYAVTIYPNGGVFSDTTTAAKTVKMSEGSTVASIDTYIAKPTRSGYVFSRWTKGESGGTDVVDPSTKINGSLTLYVQWTQLNTDINGWWLYTNTNGNKCFMHLSTTEGTGIMYDDSVESGLQQFTLTDTKITVNSDDDYAYTYANDVLTFNGITCARPSVQKTAGGTGSGPYLVMSSILLLNEDTTYTLTSTDNTDVSVSGRWGIDGGAFCLLDDDSKLVMRLTGTKKLDYETLGGHYYNYGGSAAYSNKDAYSLLLNKDGTYHFYVFGKEIQGTWYASTSGTDTAVCLSGGYGNSYKNSMKYDGTSFTTSGSSENILTQASKKGVVSEFTEDPELTGTWIFNQSGITEEFMFASDGTARMTMKMGSTEQIMDDYYFADKDKGFIYEINNTMPNILSGISSAYGYEVSANSTVLTLTFSGQSATLTKK